MSERTLTYRLRSNRRSAPTKKSARFMWLTTAEGRKPERVSEETRLSQNTCRVKPPDTENYRYLCHSDDREEWIKCRRIGIGASESAAIMGISPYESTYTAYQRRVGAIPGIEDNDYMEWGRRLEDAVATKFRDETGRSVRRNGWMLQSIQYPWLTATPDYDQDIDTPNDGVLECKTANHFAIDDWQDNTPVHYQCQTQHQMIVVARSRASLACLIGGNRFRWMDSERHERFQQALVRKTERFFRMIKGEIPPPIPDPHPSTSETLQHMIANGEVIELPDAIVAFHEMYQQAAADEKEAKERKDRYADILKAAIGEAEYGLLPNELGSYSFKTTKACVIPIPEGRRLRYSKKLPKVKKVKA